MQEQLARIEKKVDGLIEDINTLIEGLADKQSPFAREDDAPPQVRQGVEGFERVFGPKPKVGTADYSAWRKQIPLTAKVYAAVPDEYEAGAMELASRTGVKAVFVEHGGTVKAALTVDPAPWFVEPERFVGANVEGLIRAVLDAN